MNTLTPTIERAENGALTVSSQTIADQTENQHASILRLVDSNIDDFEDFGTVRFEIRPLPGGGNPQRVAHLNEQQSTLLLTYLRNNEKVRAFKKAIVKGFFEMAKQLQAPAAPAELSRMEILQLAMKAEQENLALKAEVSAAIPKVAYMDQFVADTDLLKLRAVASRLGVGETALRGLLIAKKWIYKETSSRWSESKQAKVEVTRYSAYAEKKHLFQPVMNHEAPRFKGEVMHTLKVTPSGASAIARLIDHAEEFAALTA